MIEELIQKVIKKHPYFSYEEVKEICEEFISSQEPKIKEETKLKRLSKYLQKEFELEEITEIKKENNKIYSLETIPEYLFNSKSQIVSSLIKINNLNKNIEKTTLFINADFSINSKEKISLIWKNWAWKTTLLKMILWIEEVDPWMIELASKLKIWYLSQDLFWIDKNNTLREEMMSIFKEIWEKIKRLEEIKNDANYWEEIESLNKELIEIDWFRKYELQLEILKYFWFSEDQLDFNVLMLSGWEQTKVQIAKFLIQEVDILILDEPTNHLDIEWIIFLEKFCKIWKKAILSISHDIRFIDNISDKIAEISGNKINMFSWKYHLYIEEKQALFDKQMKDYRDQQRELEVQNAYINRFRANSAKATSVQSRIKALEKIEILTKPENETKVKSIVVNLEKRLPQIVLKINNLKVWYTSKTILEINEEIEVYKTDKIWIIWWNWAWKSTFLKTILWEIEKISWEVIFWNELKIGSYSQVLENLDMEKSIIDELKNHSSEETKIRNILWWLLITWEKVEQKINTLSGWERAKVALTKMLLQKPHIIIMDEPTNHLDIQSKEVIKDMLWWFEWTTIVVSHDRDLLSNISNKIWLIKDKKLQIFDENNKEFENILN